MMRLTFLGTGAAASNGRLASSLLVDGEILIDPSPTAPWALARLRADVARLRAVVITHFHADHTFGLPTLLVDRRLAGGAPLTVVGPPGIARRIQRLLALAYPEVRFRVRAVALAPGRTLRLGPWRLRALAMKHTVPAQGYLLSRGGTTLGYSGDTELCPGLRRLVGASDAAVVEMTSRRRLPGHLTPEDVRSLRGRIIVTHLGDQRMRAPRGVAIPRDLETRRVRPRNGR